MARQLARTFRSRSARLVGVTGRPVDEPLIAAAQDLDQLQVLDDGGTRTFIRTSSVDAEGSIVFVERPPPRDGRGR